MQEQNDHYHDMSESYESDTFVAAEFDSKWYIGRILDYDPEDMEYYISLMEEGKYKNFLSFKWPNTADKLWIPESFIICKINEPVLSGTGTRKVYRIGSTDIDDITKLFDDQK